MFALICGAALARFLVRKKGWLIGPEILIPLAAATNYWRQTQRNGNPVSVSGDSAAIYYLCFYHYFSFNMWLFQIISHQIDDIMK